MTTGVPKRVLERTGARQGMLAFEVRVPADRLRNEAELSGYPLFGVERRPGFEPVNFQDPRTKRVFRVVPDSHHGMPTMGDKAIIIALVSILVRMLDTQQDVAPAMTVRASDLIRIVRPSAKGRRISSNEYDDLRAALMRLHTAKVETNVTAGKKRFDGFFSLLSELHFQTTEPDDDGDVQLEAIGVVLCEWLFRAVVHDRRFHRISPRYLDLSPLGRRLYEIGKRLTYNKDDPSRPKQSRPIPLPEFRALVGSRMERLTDFKRLLVRCIESESIPEFSLHLVGDRNSELGKAVAASGLRPMGGKRRSANAEIHVVFVPRPVDANVPAEAEGDLVMLDDVLVGGGPSDAS